MNRYLTLLLLLFALAIETQAQRRHSWTSSSRAAIRHQERAIQHYQQGDIEDALNSVKRAIGRDSAFIEAYLLLAEISMDRRDQETAVFALEYVVVIDQMFFPQALLHLGNLYISKGEYEKALSFLSRYRNMPIRSETLRKAVERSIATCHFAIEAMQNPVDFDPINLGEGVNTPLDEYFPSLTVDEQMLLFTRLDRAPSSLDGWNENLYISRYQDYIWQPAQSLGSPVNSRYNEGASAISPDGQIIVFTSCEIMRGMGYGAGRTGFGSCDLFYTYRTGNQWAVPMNLGRPVNTPRWESQPAFDADGRTLYFVRGVPAQGGMITSANIFYTVLDTNGKWSEPVMLGPHINTEGNEESVFIHPDGQTLYFSSDTHPGMGGYDIFMSRRQPDGEWGKPVNLGYPINTSKDEIGFIVNASGTTAYFSSDRPGGVGGQDIYQFELDPSLRPSPVTYLKGVVFDAETTKPIAAAFELINLNTGETVISSISDPVTGEFLLSLPTNQSWMLNVNKERYLFYSDHFELTGEFTAMKPYEKDIPLYPVRTGESMVLRNIFFDIDRDVLKPESITELERLLDLLRKNPSIEVEISGHTDNTGTRARNEELSKSRAKAVVNYLVEKGIEPDRLSYQGYADTIPIADNATAEGRALNRRTEFKVTGFR